LELCVELLAILCGDFAISHDASVVRLAFVRLELRTLTSREGVALTLFSHRHFAAQLLYMFALRRYETQQLCALRFSRRPIAMGDVTTLLRVADGGLSVRSRLTERLNAFVELLQLAVPCVHLALGEGDLDRKSPRHQLGVSFGAFSLTGERPDLTLYLGDEVV